ncbi:Macrolide export ATP-binding/permease protein MacB [bioreactor metagenome]|uniref:Macrolide export ATP-binding/permease protein MacB n=1 Tax=bioreactor metagenome TaxID=1076179 RepID=A0A644Z4K1_9ZZZZ
MAIIEVKNLCKSYGQGGTTVSALSNISLSIEKGQFVAVMGPSGCGKSTLLHLIGGLDLPSMGSVWIEGQDISKMKDNDLTEMRRRKMGFVFQFFNLIPVLSAVENAALPLILDGVKPLEARKSAAEWLNRNQMGDRMEFRPDQLSGGQQQRVAISRALVADPIILLADEPTGNLDSRASDEIALILRHVVSEWGHTVMMVTHDPRIAAYADRIIFLKDGKVVDDTLLDGEKGDNTRKLKEKADLL